MTELVENADIQFQQIGEAAIEVEHMADYSRQVAERAQSLYVIAREARETAETGRQSVAQAVEGMGRIHSYVQDTAQKVQALGDSSREIDDIVGAISNIAHQTKIVSRWTRRSRPPWRVKTAKASAQWQPTFAAWRSGPKIRPA